MLGNENIKLAIIGNKVDLLSSQEQKNPQSNALVQEAIQLTNELINARHYLSSAKLNQGIGDLFISLSRRMIEQSKKQQQLAAATSSTTYRSRRTLAVTDGSGAAKEAGENPSGGSKGGTCCGGGGGARS